MFVRGGVYRVVQEAMGGTLAKLSVSALLFDYVLTGPISAVCAGLYLAGLLNEILGTLRRRAASASRRDGRRLRDARHRLLLVAQHAGLHESSSEALHIIQITTVMVVILIGWAFVTLLLQQGGALPPRPTLANLRFSDDALGWLKARSFPAFTAIALVIGFGHSLLAMSGYESLAQVYREIESPKALNLRRTALVVFVYSVVFTAAVSFLAAALIPDDVRPQFYDNLISGIAMHLAGPHRAAAGVPGVRGGGRLPDPGERGQHGHRRLERRAQPGVGRRRPAGVVPPAPPEVRHDLPVPEPDRRPATR